MYAEGASVAGLIRDVPPAPLEHADEKEHRRQIAQRANAIAYEQGEWTPTFDFATTGDLSNSYTSQAGYYFRIGPLVHFTFYMVVTPTHTTAAGAMEIGGVPYTCSADYERYLYTIRVNGTAITWAHDDVVGVITDNENWLEAQFQGTGATGAVMGAAHIGSGTSITLRGTGFYPI